MDTTTASQPMALGPDAVIHLGVGLEITPQPTAAGFFAHEPDGSPWLTEGRVLSVFDYTQTWPYWERHPTGDELVYLVAGQVDLQLEDELGRRAVTLQVGDAAVVPRGAWHRAAIHAPSRLLFVTPTPQRTEQRPA